MNRNGPLGFFLVLNPIAAKVGNIFQSCKGLRDFFIIFVGKLYFAARSKPTTLLSTIGKSE